MMACILTDRDRVQRIVYELLEFVTKGEHIRFDDQTDLDGELGFDPIAVRGWCGLFCRKVEECGGSINLTPSDFEAFTTVGSIVDAICAELGIR